MTGVMLILVTTYINQVRAQLCLWIIYISGTCIQVCVLGMHGCSNWT